MNSSNPFKNLKSDLPSSIVVFFVALPLCLGIALASGAPLFSGIIAGIMVFGMIFLLYNYNPLFLKMTDMTTFFMVMGGIILFGILITVTSTYFALRKYLRINLDNLY